MYLWSIEKSLDALERDKVRHRDVIRTAFTITCNTVFLMYTHIAAYMEPFYGQQGWTPNA